MKARRPRVRAPGVEEAARPAGSGALSEVGVSVFPMVSEKSCAGSYPPAERSGFFPEAVPGGGCSSRGEAAGGGGAAGGAGLSAADDREEARKRSQLGGCRDEPAA